MFGMGWGELMVLAVVGLFVLGPERLPGAIRTVSAAITQAKGYLAAAREQLDSEQFAELREPLEQLRGPLADLRAADPRRAVREFLTTGASPQGNPAPPETEHTP
jgi:sec-independent protein translocase protein TatB